MVRHPVDVPPDGIWFEAERSSDPKRRERTIGAELVYDGCAHAEALGNHLRSWKELVRTRIGRQLAHHRRTKRRLRRGFCANAQKSRGFRPENSRSRRVVCTLAGAGMRGHVVASSVVATAGDQEVGRLVFSAFFP